MATRVVRGSLLIVASLSTLAAAFPTATASSATSVSYEDITTISPAPTFSPARIDLQKRQNVPSYFCGYNGAATLSCYDTQLACAGTVLANGQAYQYCYTAGASLQAVWTTMYAYGAVQVCPAYAYCWYVLQSISQEMRR